MRLSNANKVDGIQGDIVAALRRVGATVQPLNKVGDGAPDLLVGIRKRNVLMEIKSGLREPMTDDQKDWHAEWRGQVCTVFSVEDAIAVINNVR